MIRIVQNSLSGGETPFIATFEALDLLGELPLRLPYNPESWTIAVSPSWTPDNMAGATEDSSQWHGNKPRTVNIKVKLQPKDFVGLMGGDTYLIDVSKMLAVEDALQTLENWATYPSELTDRPTLVAITFGDYQYVGHLSNVTYSKMRTDHQGNALVADLAFTLTENPQ